MDKVSSIVVSSVPEELADVVETYLESTKKGGGEIRSFEYNKAKQSALVAFTKSSGEFEL